MSAASKTYQLTPVGVIALVAGLLCFLAALGFGFADTVRVGSTDVANVTSAGAACGFAIASGLCVIAAAIAESGAKRREARPAPPATSEPPVGGVA